MTKNQITRLFKPFLAFLLFLFAALSQSCDQNQKHTKTQGSTLKKTERQDLLPINKNPDDEYTYRLEWGDVKLPLEKYANPNVHKGVIEIELAALLKMLSQKIRVYKGDKALDAELINLSRPRGLTTEQLWYEYPSTKNGYLEANLVDTLKEKLQTGDQVYMRMTAKSEDLHIQSAVFQIGAPGQGYWTPGLRSNLQKGGEVYAFQIINEEGRQPVLRIDTTNEKTQHILKLYQENIQYKIIHIPNFKTRKRLITEQESLFANKDIQQTAYLGYDFDLYTLSDYTNFIGKKVELHWGELIANPSSETYEIAQLGAQLPGQPELWIGRTNYKVKGFHLILSGKTQKPKRFIASAINATELYHTLLKLPAFSSVYFEHIIIEDRNQDFHFPAAFSFHFGEKQEFDLEVNPSVKRQIARHTIDSSDGNVQINFYAADLKSIISELMEFPEGKLRYANFDDNPVLDVSFESEKLNLNAGKDLIVRRLCRMFKLSIESHTPRPTFNLRVKEAVLLNQFLASEQEEALTLNIVDNEKIAQFEGVSMETLTRFIDRELDFLIINDTQLKDKPFQIKLNYSSLDQVRKSLEEIGLELTKNKEYVQVVVTRLY